MSTTVGGSTGYVPNFQMSAFGYVMAALLIVVVLPVLPVIVVVWILWRVFVAEEPTESRYDVWREERIATSASSDREGEAANPDESVDEDERDDEADADDESTDS